MNFPAVGVDIPPCAMQPVRVGELVVGQPGTLCRAGGWVVDHAQFDIPDVVCVVQPTEHGSEVRDPDRVNQRLFYFDHGGADFKRNPSRPVTCHAGARKERGMLRRALGASLLTLLQGQMESPRCLVRVEAVKLLSFSFSSDMKPPFLNLGVDRDQEKRHESLPMARVWRID